MKGGLVDRSRVGASPAESYVLVFQDSWPNHKETTADPSGPNKGLVI